MSGLVILMTLVGGMGTMVGPILGAFIIIALENKLGDLGSWLAARTQVEWFATLGESVGIVTGLIFITPSRTRCCSPRRVARAPERRRLASLRV